MADIILDCDLMKHPNSGLYYYCLNLGNSVQELMIHENMKLKYYAPYAERQSFYEHKNVIVERSLHRFIRPFLWRCRVWHAPFQSGRIVPDRRLHPNIKVLLTIHDLNPLHEGKPVEEQRASLSRTQALIDRSDAIVCISEFCRRDVLANCDTGNRPIYVIHNGTNLLHEPALHRLSYQPARPFLFGMGYLNRKKNYHVLLSLLKSDENLELIIAGRHDEPDYITRMQEQAKEWGLTDRLCLTGPITENEKAWYLKNCRAFVHPSLAEGFGFPVIEAMSFGKPVFLSNLTSLPEIGGDVAFYFSSFADDHMEEVFQLGMQRYDSNGMSEMIRARGRQFDWKRSAAEYLKVYQTLY